MSLSSEKGAKGPLFQGKGIKMAKRGRKKNGNRD